MKNCFTLGGSIAVMSYVPTWQLKSLLAHCCINLQMPLGKMWH